MRRVAGGAEAGPCAGQLDAPPAGPALAGRLRFAGLAYALSILIIGTNLPTPLYARYERAFGLSALDVTALVAVYAGAVACALVLCGPLSDVVGHRPVVTAGLAGAAAGSALLAGASGFGWLAAGRAVQGLAVGACSGTLSAGLVIAEPRGRRDRASFIAATVTTAAVGAGPVLAGVLARFGPDPLVVPYLVEMGLLIPAVAAAVALPPRFGATGGRWRPRRPRLPARRREFAVSSAVGLLGWAIAYVALALVPSYAAAALGRGDVLVDGGAAGSLLLFAAAAQVAGRNWGAARSQRTGLALLVAGLALLVAAGFAGGPAGGGGSAGGGGPAAGLLLLGAVAFAGSGQGLGFGGALKRVNELAPPAERAATISLFYMITYIGAGLAAVGVGALALWLPLTAAIQAFAALFALVCAAALAGMRRGSRCRAARRWRAQAGGLRLAGSGWRAQAGGLRLPRAAAPATGPPGRRPAAGRRWSAAHPA